MANRIMLESILQGPLGALKESLDVIIPTGLGALVGIMLLLGGMGAMPFNMPDLSLLTRPEMLLLTLPPLLATIGGIIMLPVGVGLLGAAAMFFKGKERGWTLSKKLAVLGIVLSFMLMSGTADTGKLTNLALGVGLSGVLLGFLNTPQVKALYGKPADEASEEEQPVELEAEDEDAEAIEAAEA